MKYKKLSEFQAKQKEILAQLPSLSSRFIDLSKIGFEGENKGRVSMKMSEKEGIKVEELKQALQRDPSLLRYFNDHAFDKALVHNHAYFHAGKYVVIEKDGDYELTLEGNGNNVVKNVFIVKKGVKCTLFCRILGSGEINIADVIYVEQGGECKFGFFNGFQGVLSGFNQGFVEARGRLDLYDAQMNSGVTRMYLENHFLENNASGNIFNVYSCRGEMELHFQIYCKAKGNKSLALSKGIVLGNGRVYFEGYAHIDKNADGADIFVGEHAMVMHKGAKANLVPHLEIENNNVKAGHAASVQQFDEEKLFYMQSRGLSEEECKKLLIEGFLYSVVEKMEIPLLQAEIKKLL